MASRTPAVVLAGCLLTTLAAGCDSSPDRPASASGSGSDAASASTFASGGGASTAAGSSSAASSHAEQVPFGSLIERPQQFLAQPVEVLGKVFFVANCPPPGGNQEPCVLVGYLADPTLDHLLPGQIGEALPLVQNDRAVSCPEPAADRGACPGWQQATRYRITGTIRNRVLGGRTTKYFELVVRSKQRG